MTTLFDARGNEFQGALDQIGGGTFTDARVASGTLGALNAELVMDLHGKAVSLFEIRSAASAATYVFEGTLDGTNYFALPARSLAGTIVAVVQSEAFVASVVSTAAIAAVYVVNTTGWRRVRCRVSAYTSGNAVVTSRATEADFAIIAQPQPSILHVTAVATAAVATATLTGVAGLFHYITHIEIQRAATAVLAGTALLTHTSTNLPGSPAWTSGNVMVAGGVVKDLLYEPQCPLKSLVAGTNTTIVGATPGVAVTCRINVSYYLSA